MKKAGLVKCQKSLVNRKIDLREKCDWNLTRVRQENWI